MNFKLFAVGMSCLSLCCFFSLVAQSHAEERTRNPFGVKDVPDPDGADVQAFAKEHLPELTGKDDDPNAEKWVAEETAGNAGSLGGKWFDRWGKPDSWMTSRKASEVRVVGDRVYILANCTNGKFLLDLRRDKNRLIGRYQGIDTPTDTGPCVFLIVGDERLDGRYRGARWDFQRDLK